MRLYRGGGFAVNARMKVGVIQFPGSNCDWDGFHAFSDALGQPTRMIWHKETSLGDCEALLVPGGFSYGDYLRCGAIARFSPVMKAVADFAKTGGRVLGVCNGFQILCEAGLLPGALVRNNCLEFRCRTACLRVENACEGFNPSALGTLLRIPIAHGEGNYRIDEEGLKRLEGNGQVLLRYCDPAGNLTDEANPNGSIAHIAGIRNEAGNVWGMMPHPERAVEPYHPSQDGIGILRAFLGMEQSVPACGVH